MYLNNLLENNIVVFANFESDYRSLINSGLPVPEYFHKYKFHYIL
jgi:hypothetical protein